MDTRSIDERLRGVYERSAPAVNEAAFRARLRHNTGRRPTRTLAVRHPRRRLVLAALSTVVILAVLGFGVSTLVEWLGRDQRVVVITDDSMSPDGRDLPQPVTPAATTGASQTTGAPTKSADTISVLEGPGRLLDIGSSYVLFSSGVEEEVLEAFDPAAGESILLDDAYRAQGDLRPHMAGDVAVWPGTHNGRLALRIQPLPSIEGRAMAAPLPVEASIFRFTVSGDSWLLLTEERGDGAMVLNLVRYETAEATDALTEIVRVAAPSAFGYDRDGFLQADMDEGHIAWSAPAGESREIFIYEISTGKTTQLTDDLVMDFKPSVAGNLVAWLSGAEDEAQVYLHDLATGLTKKIGGGVRTRDVVGGNGVQASPGRPQTDGRFVVWWEIGPEGSNIKAYDSETDETLDLSGESRADGGPHLADGKVAWIRWAPDGEETQIIARDLRSMPEEKVIAKGRVTDPMVGSGYVGWFAWESTAGYPKSAVPEGIRVAPFPAESDHGG